MGYKTEQENFWAGEFGSAYIERNKSNHYLAADIALFSEILNATHDVESVIEFGSNIGINLKAMKTLKPEMKCAAIEINHDAVEVLKADSFFGDSLIVYENSILEFDTSEIWDFVLIKGVLIHMNPNELQHVYEKLYHASAKYICIAEYYNPTPVELNYRGNTDRLFKRDFAGEFMDKFKDVKMVNYGFKYHRDNNFPADDITWFLFEKM